MKKRGIQILAAAAAAVGLLAVMFLLVKTKRLQVNRWIVSDKDVVGVDISEYQADVDMQKLASIAQTEDNCLILVTCENELVDGGYQNRRAVFAKPVN